MSNASNQIFAMIVATSKEIERAQAIGDQASAIRLEGLREELIRKEAALVLSDASASATELADLAAILDSAKRDIDQSNDLLFVGDLSKVSQIIESEAKVFDRQEHFYHASDESAHIIEPSSNANQSSAPPLIDKDYFSCFKQMQIRGDWQAKADAVVLKIVREQSATRYRKVELLSGVPWWFVGIIHLMETSLRFNAHLHNGDSLSAKTKRVPAGRPENWQAGMSWELSAADALRDYQHEQDWSVGHALHLMEKYNGLGYRNRARMTPYLWSGCKYFDRGKFVADSIFDEQATSSQVGAALVLHRLIALEFLAVSAKGEVGTSQSQVQQGLARLKSDPLLLKHVKAELDFPVAITKSIGQGFTSRTGKAKWAVKRIQEWCCLHQCTTGIDGDFGPSTHKSVKLFQHKNNLHPTGLVDNHTWVLLTAPMQRATTALLNTAAKSFNETVLAISRQHIAQNPTEVGGNNCGPWVRLYMQGKEGESQPWCAGFVSSVVRQAAAFKEMQLPFKRQVGVDELVKDAKNTGRFISESSLRDPQVRASKIIPGSLFVIRRNSRDWTHVGIVTKLGNDSFLTIEGNTNGQDVDGGNAKFSNRSYAKKDFLALF